MSEYQCIRVEMAGDVAVVTFADEMMVSEQEVARTCSAELHALFERDGHHHILIDLMGVRFIPSILLNGLIGLQMKLQPCGGKLRLCCLHQSVDGMMENTSMRKFFKKIPRSREDALSDW